MTSTDLLDRAARLNKTARLWGLRPVPTLRFASGAEVEHATTELTRLNVHLLADDAPPPRPA
ncbi:MAG: hypothetical protein ABSE49_31135 [Polyangiaceae bacterium]|jgi:hypothetical protein